MVALRRGRNSPLRRFLFAKLFLCAFCAKEKASKPFCRHWNDNSVAPLTQGSLSLTVFCLKTKFPQTKKTVGGISFYRNNISERASTLFLLPIAGTKEKAKQKENAVREFRRLRAATEGSAFGYRKPLKRLEPNFKTGEGWSSASPFCRHCLRVRTSPFGEYTARFGCGHCPPLTAAAGFSRWL